MTSTTQPTSVRQGLDLEVFERFCEYAEANPADVQFEFEASGVYEGRAVHTTATTGPYSLGGQRIDRIARRYTHHFGAHKEVEEALGFTEPTDREEVVEIALAALSACINAAVGAAALARGIELTRLRTDVRIGWNPFVFLMLTEPDGADGPVDQFGGLEVELELGAELLSDDDVAYLRESVKRSAVFNLITSAHESSPVVTVK